MFAPIKIILLLVLSQSPSPTDGPTIKYCLIVHAGPAAVADSGPSADSDSSAKDVSGERSAVGERPFFTLCPTTLRTSILIGNIEYVHGGYQPQSKADWPSIAGDRNMPRGAAGRRDVAPDSAKRKPVISGGPSECSILRDSTAPAEVASSKSRLFDPLVKQVDGAGHANQLPCPQANVAQVDVVRDRSRLGVWINLHTTRLASLVLIAQKDKSILGVLFTEWSVAVHKLCHSNSPCSVRPPIEAIERPVSQAKFFEDFQTALSLPRPLPSPVPDVPDCEGWAFIPWIPPPLPRPNPRPRLPVSGDH